MATETLHISLPDNLKRYVEQQVADGGYGNTSEYIRELIRRDREERKRQAQEKLEALLLEGLDSLERDERIEVTPEYWSERRARLLAQFEAQQNESRERQARLGEKRVSGASHRKRPQAQ
jgi:antitoxin ParD1/3/4